MEGDCALTLFAYRAERVPNAISREFSSRDRSPRAADSHVPRPNRGIAARATYLGRKDRNFNVLLITFDVFKIFAFFNTIVSH